MLPADLELQLAVPTPAYHCLGAFHDLTWRGKADCQIGPTLWPEWLQADEQRHAVRDLGPVLTAARAPDASAPGRILAPRTVPLAYLLFAPASESYIRKSVAFSPTTGATEPTKCPLCADRFYTSGAMLEHLAWHAVHATAPAEDKEAASTCSGGRVNDLCGKPSTPSGTRPASSPGSRVGR